MDTHNEAIQITIHTFEKSDTNSGLTGPHNAWVVPREARTDEAVKRGRRVYVLYRRGSGETRRLIAFKALEIGIAQSGEYAEATDLFINPLSWNLRVKDKDTFNRLLAIMMNTPPDGEGKEMLSHEKFKEVGFEVGGYHLAKTGTELRVKCSFEIRECSDKEMRAFEQWQDGLDVDKHGVLLQEIRGVVEEKERYKEENAKLREVSGATLKEALDSYGNFAVGVDERIAEAVRDYVRDPERSYARTAEKFNVSKKTVGNWFSKFEEVTQFHVPRPKPGENFSVREQIELRHEEVESRKKTDFVDNIDA